MESNVVLVLFFHLEASLAFHTLFVALDATPCGLLHFVFFFICAFLLHFLPSTVNQRMSPICGFSDFSDLLTISVPFLKYIVPERLLFVVDELALGWQVMTKYLDKNGTDFSFDEWEIGCFTTCWSQPKWLYLRNSLGKKKNIVSSLFCSDTCLYGTDSRDTQGLLWKFIGTIQEECW